MQVPTFVNVVAASCILRCCGGFFVGVELSGVCSSAMTAIFFRSTHARSLSLALHRPSTALERVYTRIFIGTAPRSPVPRPPTRGGLGTPKIYGTGTSINFGPPCLHDKNSECRAQKSSARCRKFGVTF